MYIIKLTIFTILITIIALIYIVLLTLMYPWRKTLGPVLLQFASKWILIYFGVKIDYADKIDLSALKNNGVVLVSNHVTMLDIFLLSAIYKTVFVSKVELKYYPIFGQVGSLIGIIFLRRSSNDQRSKLIRTIAYESVGRVVTIFPQGTTSSFADPLPFKCGIFKALEINKDVVIYPVTIHYLEEKKIAWLKNQLLLENIKMICIQNKIHVRVKVHSPVTANDLHDKTITEICGNTQEKVLSKLWDTD